MKPWQMLILFIFFPNLAFNQGLVVDFERFDQVPKLPIDNDGSKSTDQIEYKPKVDLRPYCPTPQHQGAVNSCTGWAVGYGALTILRAIKENWSGLKDSINQNAFSALFIYNQVKKNGSCDAGSDIADAGNLLMEKGNLKSYYFDRFKNQCDRLPSLQELDMAKPFKIKEYFALFGKDDQDYEKINKVKLSLTQEKPVVIGMEIRASLRELKNGDQFWYPSVGNQRFEGSHAMVVVGYDDGKEAFEIMNSWGTEWGNKGFFWIKYKDFAQLTYFAYQFRLSSGQSAENLNINASLVLRKAVFDQNNQINFLNEKVIFNGKFYETVSLKRGTLIQPYLENINPGSYFYMFSFEPSRKITLYYPPDTTVRSPRIAYNQTKMAVPSDSIALGFNTVGYEYICFLISKKPIPNLAKVFKQLSAMPVTDFVNNLYTVFGKQLEPLIHIQYQKDVCAMKSQFKVGVIAPIVIRCKIIP